MQKIIKNLLERNATLIALILSIIIAISSLKTITLKHAISITYLDKILHFGSYFILTLSWCFSQRTKNNKPVIIILLILFGILLEFSQDWFTSNRTKDIYDIIANSLGVIFATYSFKYLYKYYKKIFGYSN